jgi:hypothetical protein
MDMPKTRLRRGFELCLRMQEENRRKLSGFWWAQQDSNLRPTDYESAALTD